MHTRINILFYPQTDPPIDLESVLSPTGPDGSEYDLSTQRQSIDKNVEIIIQVDPERLSPYDDRNLSGLGAITSERLRDALTDPLSRADPPEASTTVRGTPSPRLGNHLIATDRHIDDPFEDEIVTSKISRITRDKEHILGKGISRSVHEEENTTEISTRKDLAENATHATVLESIGEENSRGQLMWTGKSNVRFSRMNEDGATTAVALVAIGAIMLLVGPVVIILRILDERRRTRKLIALSASAREDPPPTYEQAVLMDEAPRYSTLALNYDHTPPPSPTHSSTYAFSNVAT